MNFSVARERLLEPLLAVHGVVERRQTLPILANVLFTLNQGRLTPLATDMEVELSASVALESDEAVEVTLPARKLVDICRSLPADAELRFEVQDSKVLLRSGRSRFTLSTLPASEFPTSEAIPDPVTLEIEQQALHRLVELTSFSMAHQDVRYYLNGLLLEFEAGRLRAVATDGHRLAISETALEVSEELSDRQIIVPRKGVAELQRLLGSEGTCSLTLGANAMRVEAGEVALASKLIDGRFPDYNRVIPDAERCDKRLVVEREAMRQMLGRAAILSNDKYRAVRLSLEPGTLRVVASNPEQEEAEDELPIEYEGETIEIGFNVSYLLDALNALPDDSVRLFLTDSGSSCLMMPGGGDSCRFVVMPMRL